MGSTFAATRAASFTEGGTMGSTFAATGAASFTEGGTMGSTFAATGAASFTAGTGSILFEVRNGNGAPRADTEVRTPSAFFSSGGLGFLPSSMSFVASSLMLFNICSFSDLVTAGSLFWPEDTMDIRSLTPSERGADAAGDAANIVGPFAGGTAGFAPKSGLLNTCVAIISTDAAPPFAAPWDG